MTPPDHRPLDRRPVTAEQVADRVLAGTWIVDLRSGLAPVGAAHPHVGWLLTVDDDLALLSDVERLRPDDVERLGVLGIEPRPDVVVADVA